MNDNVYIRFDDPKPEKPLPLDGPVKKAVKNAIIKMLTTIIPKANPGFEDLLDNVEYWKIEFNKEENWTWREIGFDKNGNSIVAMPLGNNYGYWSDSHLTLDDYEHFNPTTITADEFENDWTEFEKKNEKITLANKG
jgi:hypothetical protein